MSRKLKNYLRTYRKRAGLSQVEMAYLLGCRSGAKVSRYERFARQPSLQAVFAYEVVFGVPARELFGGVFQQVEGATLRRAQSLVRKLKATKPDSIAARKLKVLRSATSTPMANSGNHL